MPRYDDEYARTTRLYEELARLGLRDRRLTPEVLEHYEAILGCAGTRLRVRGPKTRVNLAAAAYDAITTAVKAIPDVRTRVVADAAICLSEDYWELTTKARLLAVARHPDLAPYGVDADFYKYHRRKGLLYLYEALSRPANEHFVSPGHTFAAEGRTFVDPHHQSKALSLFRGIQRLYYGFLAQLCIARLDARLLDEKINPEALQSPPGQFPAVDDLLFPALLDWYEAVPPGEPLSWITAYYTEAQREALEAQLETFAILQGPARDIVAEWATARWWPVTFPNDKALVEISEATEARVRAFYSEHWLPWLRRESPGFATNKETRLDYFVSELHAAVLNLWDTLPLYAWTFDEPSADAVWQRYAALPIAFYRPIREGIGERRLAGPQLIAEFLRSYSLFETSNNSHIRVDAWQYWLTLRAYDRAPPTTEQQERELKSDPIDRPFVM